MGIIRAHAYAAKFRNGICKFSSSENVEGLFLQDALPLLLDCYQSRTGIAGLLLGTVDNPNMYILS